MLTDLLKWGGKRSESSSRSGDAPAPRDEPIVASKAFPKFVATLSQREAPVLLDLGPVIGSNVAFCGERLGCKLFIEDFLADVDRQLRGKGGALAEQIVRMLRPGGAVMGFFCTTAVERSSFTKFEIIDEHSLRHRHHPGVG